MKEIEKFKVTIKWYANIKYLSRIVKSRLKIQEKQWYENSDIRTSNQAVDLNSEAKVFKSNENSENSELLN